jgi:hypothetical protein
VETFENEEKKREGVANPGHEKGDEFLYEVSPEVAKIRPGGNPGWTNSVPLQEKRPLREGASSYMNAPWSRDHKRTSN